MYFKIKVNKNSNRHTQKIKFKLVEYVTFENLINKNEKNYLVLIGIAILLN